MQHNMRLQGANESLHLDIMVHLGTWEFDPMEMENQFPNNEESVYLCQGHKDKLVPFHRYRAKKLPRIRYHEGSAGGHLMIHEKGLCEAILRGLLLGEEPSYLIIKFNSNRTVTKSLPLHSVRSLTLLLPALCHIAYWVNH